MSFGNFNPDSRIPGSDDEPTKITKKDKQEQLNRRQADQERIDRNNLTYEHDGIDGNRMPYGLQTRNVYYPKSGGKSRKYRKTNNKKKNNKKRTYRKKNKKLMKNI